MDTSSYDTKIQQAYDARSALYNEMEKLVEEFIAAASKGLQASIGSAVENAVTGNAEVAKSAGLAKLKELKTELKALIEHVPVLVKERIDQETIWEHRSTPNGPLTWKMANDLKQNFNHASTTQLRHIQGTAGELIVKYGFARVGEDGWDRNEDGRIVYKYWITALDDLKELLKKYGDLFSKFVGAHIKAGELQKEKEHAIAKDLWDQA